MSRKKRKFYETTIVVRVLSEDYYIDEKWDLEAIGRQIDQGDACGDVTIEKVRRLGNRETANLLKDFGSEPEFFSLDDRGRTTF